ANAAPSSAHWKVAPAPASGEMNVNVAVVLMVGPLGPPGRICVSGVRVSTAQAYTAGDRSTLPARSRARTANECAPSPTGPNDAPLVHGRKPPLSSEQSNVTDASLERKLNCAMTLLSWAGGPLSSIVSGATVSIVHTRSAGVSSLLPAASTALTEKLWLPSDSVRTYGDWHGCATSLSIRHWNVAVGSSDENRNVAWPLRLNMSGA